MALVLYDLCGADAAVRFSPPCWMAKFALLHKDIAFETAPLRFSEKENYPDPEYGLLPVLEDNGELVRDSEAIAAHLDAKYPEKPLFANDGERAAYHFYRAFAGAHVFPALAPLMFFRVAGVLGPEDAQFFRHKREERLGKSLETAANDESLRPRLESALAVLSVPLERFPFFGGEAPNQSDYLIGGVFMWQRSVTAETFYTPPTALSDWFERILDLFDGYGRNAKRAAIS